MPEPKKPEQGQWNSRMALLNVCLAVFMAGLNDRALLVSLPTLTRVFRTSLTTIQWTLLVYDLALVGLVLTFGRLGDLFGRKKLYGAGFVLFVCGSALCGLSQSTAQLIAFRIVQGIGGSLLTANGRAILSAVFPVNHWGRTLGLMSMAFHVGLLAGPTLGGFLIDTLGWRWIFFINIPVGVVGAYLALKILFDDRKEKRERVRIDFQGAFLLLLANSSLLYAINELPQLGIYDPKFLSFGLLAVAAFFLFVWTEFRAEAPILSLRLFRNRLFSFGNLSLFFIYSTQSAVQFLLPFYLQSIMGFSPSQMGWIIIINSVVIVVVAPLAGWLSDRLGSQLLCTAGAGLIVTAQFLIAFFSLESTVAGIMFPLALSGLGWAIFNAPNTSTILGSVPKDQVGVASGMTTTMARIGAVMGIALSATIFTQGLAAAGLSEFQIASPQSWGSSPTVFVRTFRHTVHIINLFTLVSVFASAVRGGRNAT